MNGKKEGRRMKRSEMKTAKGREDALQSNIRKLRMSRGLSQKRLADEVGVVQQSISRYEIDIYSMPVDMAVHLASYYDVTVEYLLGIAKKKRGYPNEKLEREEEQLVDLYDLLSLKDRRFILETMKELAQKNQ